MRLAISGPAREFFAIRDRPHLENAVNRYCKPRAISSEDDVGAPAPTRRPVLIRSFADRRGPSRCRFRGKNVGNSTGGLVGAGAECLVGK